MVNSSKAYNKCYLLAKTSLTGSAQVRVIFFCNLNKHIEGYVFVSALNRLISNEPDLKLYRFHYDAINDRYSINLKYNEFMYFWFWLCQNVEKILRYLLIIFLLLCSTSCFSMVADDDDRYHPTVKDLTHTRWVNPAKMNTESMGVFAKAIGVTLQDGYEVGAIQFNNNKQAGIINISVPEEAPLIVFVGNDYTIAVYQKDDKKSLASIKDCLKPECIRKKTDWGLDLRGFEGETFYEPGKEE